VQADRDPSNEEGGERRKCSRLLAPQLGKERSDYRKEKKKREEDLYNDHERTLSPGRYSLLRDEGNHQEGGQEGTGTLIAYTGKPSARP